MIVRRARLDQILALRHAVLRPGRPPATALFNGDEAPTTVHVGAWEGDALVGCASMIRASLDGADAVQLRGMATRPGHERGGVGTAILRFLEGCAKEVDVGVCWCNARTSARGFYEHAGWEVVSDEFEIADVGPHVRMVRRAALTRTFRRPPEPAPQLRTRRRPTRASR